MIAKVLLSSDQERYVIIEIFQISFCVFVHAFPLEISSFLNKSFPFLFPCFVLSILRYFPSHIVSFTTFYLNELSITFRIVFLILQNVVCHQDNIPSQLDKTDILFIVEHHQLLSEQHVVILILKVY